MKEFEKWYKETQKGWCIQVYSPMEIAWKAALRMIKYEGIISDYELAGKIIKDELEGE